MLSLTKVVGEQTEHLAEQGDKTPSEQRKLNIDMESKFTAEMSVLERINLSLTSQNQSHILWALSNVSKIAARDKTVLRSVSTITNLLNSERTQNIEFAVVCCCTELATNYGDLISVNLIDPIIKRMYAFPAIEYVKCLEHTIVHLSSAILKDKLFTAVMSLAKMSESHQYAAAELLLILPFNKIDFKSEDFKELIGAKIIGTHYLPELVALACSYFDKKWQENLPKQLSLQANTYQSIREGTVKAVLSSVELVENQHIYFFVMTSFGWAAQNESVGMAIVEKADVISKLKNGEFQNRVREIGIRLAQGSSTRKAELCAIYAKNPQTFLSNESYVKKIYHTLAESPETEVKLSFVQNFHLLYGKCQSPNLRDMLFSYILPYYSSMESDIKAGLIMNAQIYAVIGQARLNALLPHFLKIVGGVTKWRLLAQAIKICTDLPDEIVQSQLSSVVNFVNGAVSQSPFALADAATRFYSTVTRFSIEDRLVSMLVDTFASSFKHQLRSLFVVIATGLGFSVTIECFAERIWPVIVSLGSDDVSSVRCTVLKNLHKIRRIFIKQGYKAGEKQILTLFMIIGKDEDPYIQTVWRQCSDGVTGKVVSCEIRSEARDLSMTGIIDKPVSMVETTTKGLFKSTNLIHTPMMKEPKSIRTIRQGTPKKVGITIPKTQKKKKVSLDALGLGYRGLK